MNKKELLLQSAKKLFAHQGFDKTSIREIALDAGVNSSMISYYFGSKEKMIPYIFEHYFPTISELPKTDNPKESLRALITQIIKLRIHDKDLVDILHSEIILKSERMDSIKPYIASSWQRLYELIEQCHHDKLIHIESVDVAYMYILAGVSFPYHNKLFTPHQPLSETSIKIIVDMFMKGLE